MRRRTRPWQGTPGGMVRPLLLHLFMKTLVLYFSRSGNTRAVARRIADKLNAEIEELTDRTNRRGIFGYLRSGREAFLGLRANLNPIASRLSDFDLVVIGTPVWNMSLSSPIRTFLLDHAAELPRVAFFCTLGGMGRDRVLREMERLAGKAPLSTLVVTEHELEGGDLGRLVDRFVTGIPEEPSRPRGEPAHAS